MGHFYPKLMEARARKKAMMEAKLIPAPPPQIRRRAPDGNLVLTKLQEKTAKLRVKYPNATLAEIGEKLGYKRGAWGKQNQTCKVFATLKLDQVKTRIRELMEASPKLRVPALLRKLEQGLGAKETKFFSHNGEVTDQREVIDYATRRGYLDTAFDLYGVKEKQGGPTANFFGPEAFEQFITAYYKGINNGPTT